MKKLFSLIVLTSFLLVMAVYPQEKKTFALHELIDIGLKLNPELNETYFNVKALHEAYLASKRFSNPEFEYSIGDSESYEGDIQRITQDISIHQSIENPLKRHFRLQMNKKSWEASELEFEYLKLETTCKIKEIFYEILFLKENEELWNQKKDSIQKIHQLVQKRAELGEVKELEVLKLSVEMLRAQNELNEAETELKLAKDSLNKFLGESLPPDFEVQGELKYFPFKGNEEYFLNEKLNSHPLVIQKKVLFEKAQHTISYVKWQRIPDFSLAAFSQKMLHGTSQGIGISFDIPLWDFKSREILEAENKALSRSHELKRLKIELANQIRSKLNRLNLSEKTIKLFKEALLKQARESLRISRLSYSHGEISLIDFLDAQRTYYSILSDYQDALLKWNLDKVSLERALGDELK